MLNKAPESRPRAEDIARQPKALAHPGAKRRGFLWAGLAAALEVATIGWTMRQRQAPVIVPLAPVPLAVTAGFDSWPGCDGNNRRTF